MKNLVNDTFLLVEKSKNSSLMKKVVEEDKTYLLTVVKVKGNILLCKKELVKGSDVIVNENTEYVSYNKKKNKILFRGRDEGKYYIFNTKENYIKMLVKKYEEELESKSMEEVETLYSKYIMESVGL